MEEETIRIESVPLTTALTVEAWVETRDARGEGLQALVSQWAPPDEWCGFAATDATSTGGLPSRGYYGAVFDGRYVYFVPEQHGEAGFPTHGVVLRLDTHGDFRAPASFDAYDAGRTDGMETRGYYGGVFDGRYVYFVPRQIDMTEYHCRLLRFDTRGTFHDDAGWAAFDVGVAHSHQSAAFDGRYIYLCPGFTGDPTQEDQYSGLVVRYDTDADFKSRTSYDTVDLTSVLDDECACFDGAVFDGRYVFFVPLYNGVVVRYDSHRAFADPKAWERYDAKPHGYALSVGAVFEGEHVYFCAYGHGVIVRYHTQRPFTDARSWDSYDATTTGGLRTTGFDGGFFDGRYVTFQPFFERIGPAKRDVAFHSRYLRYDTARPFSETASWQSIDASCTEGLPSVGYNGGAFDGRYFYAAPWQQGRKPDVPDEIVTHGIVLRCDTVGNNGAFSLRYSDTGHNGGLNAALPGPTFIINTDRGPRTVAAHRALPPGSHHIAGTYDRRVLKLFIDGERVAQRPADGQIVSCGAPVTVGSVQNGCGRFRGRVLAASVLGSAYTDTEIKAIAFGHMAEAEKEASLRIEMDTHLVLDGRESLTGKVFVPSATRWIQLVATQLDSGAVGWQTHVGIEADSAASEHEFAIPVASMSGGHYRLAVQTDAGEQTTVVLALRDMRRASAPACPGYLAFARAAVDRILAEQTRRLFDDPHGVPFVTVTRPLSLGYRSLGHKSGDAYTTYWFPERPFEYPTFRADHESWPILDTLSDLTGDSTYAALVTGMLEAIAEHGFDPRSGLMYLSEECDFDVRVAGPHSKGASNLPKFKPLNSGNYPQLHLDRMWQQMPTKLHRCFRAMFYGLVTDPDSFDYNRFCMYGFDDSAGTTSLTRNGGHCAFDTAAGRMIHWWCSCWRHTGDADCVDWAQRMADKWAAVQHPVSGLVPNFFGATGWAPGTSQRPGEWCEARGAALTALSLMQAVSELRHRPGAEELAERLTAMSREMALGVARWSYDPDRRVFLEHLHRDGRPWSGTARYCFSTEEEKAEAVRKDPQMAQVRVYDGAGLYRDPNYYEHCAGTHIPWHMASAAALDDCPEPELVQRLCRIADDVLDEARKLDGAFTPEGRWTFRATAQYVKLCLVLARMTGDRAHVSSARELADREIRALSPVRCPEWWRMRERSALLEAMLLLHSET